MKGQTNLDSFQYFATITKDYSTYKTKVKAISSLNKKSFEGFEIVLLFVEYLQLMSQPLLLSPTLYDDPSMDAHLLYKGVIFCAKIFNPGFWVDLESYDTLNFVILSLFTVFTVFKYALFLYVFIIVITDKKGQEPLLFIWRLIFKCQARTLCYFATSFWVKVILTVTQNEHTITGVDANSMKILASCMIALEYILSLFLQLRYCYILPTKSFLAQKDIYLEAITLTQKIVIQILQLISSSSTAGIRWVYTSFNIIFSLMRETHFFAALPFYNFKALLYQGRLLMIVFSLNLACFIENLSHELGHDTNMGFIIIVWIILALLTGQISNEYLRRIQYTFAYGDSRASIKFRVHKISALKDLLKQKQTPSESTFRYELAFLLNASMSEDILGILHVNSDFQAQNDINVDSKRSMNLMFVQYLQYLRIKSPRDEFLKLYIAYFYAKKLRLYGVAIKITNELKQSYSNSIALSASLLIYDIQKTIKKQLTSDESSLDLFKYLQSRSLIAEIEAKMLKQIEVQSTLYNEVLTESADLHKIVQYSMKIHTYRGQIEKQMRFASENIPGSYIKPLMICSLYHLSLNHSVSDYLDYRKKYNQRYIRHEKAFTSERMNPESAYQDNAVFMVISGQKPDAGRIFYCSKSMRDVFGKEAQLCIGTMATTLSPPCFRAQYGQFYENVGEKGDRALLGKYMRAFAWHKQGYLVDCDFYVNIQPFMTQGFFLNLILRPIVTVKDFILLHENGDIEGATRNVARKLGLLHSENFGLASVVNIKSLSPMLKKVNDAFNLMDAFTKSNVEKKENYDGIVSGISSSNLSEYHSPGRRQPKHAFRTTESHRIEMSLQKAQEFYNIFTTDGQDLELTSLLAEGNDAKHPNYTHVYHCKMENQASGSLLLKLITLEEREAIEQGEEHISVHVRKPNESLQVPSARPYGEDYKTSEDEHNNMEEMLNESADFNLEDEKKSGWINLKILETSPYSPITRTLSPSIPFETGEEPLNSPFRMDSAMTTPKAPLIQRTHNNIQHVFNQPSKSTKSIYEENNMKEEEHHAAAKAFVVEGSVASTKSRGAQDKKISNAFKMALSVDHAPGVFKIMTVVFYGLLITIFAIQLDMKNTLENAVTNLKVGKDVVTSSEERSFVLANIMLMARLIWDIGTSRINTTGLGAFDYPAWLYASFVESDSRTIATLSQMLLSNSSFVTDEMREKLFTKDIRIYNTPEDRVNGNYTLLNNFQAIDRVSDTGLKATSILDTSPVEDAQEQLYFLLDNTVNDIYVKNEAISDSFMAFLENEGDKIDNSVTVNVIVTISLFTSVGVILSAISWKKYYTEKSKLLAVSKLSTQGITSALDRVTQFKRILENDVTFNRNNSMVLGNDRQTVKEIGSKRKDKREHSKAPKYGGILRKYVFYTGRLWFFMIFLVGLTIGHCLSGKSSITFFQQKQAQLYFSQRLKSQVTLVGVVTQELFAGNGSTLNHNEATADLLPNSIAYLRTLKNRVPSTFIKEDLSYDADIYDILFGAGCPSIEDPTWYSFCIKMAAKGQKTSVIYLLGDFEELAEAKMYEFETIDRTSEQALTDAQVEDFERIVVDYFAIANECGAITKIVNKQFEDELSTSKDSRNLLFIIFILVLILLGFLVWIFVLLKLKDFSRQLKIVLQAFPAGLVLSSFPLKTFLVNSSRGALDFVKNEI